MNVEKSYLLRTAGLGLALMVGPAYPLIFMELDFSQVLLAWFVVAVGGLIVYNCWKFHKNPLRHSVDEQGIWIYKNLAFRRKFIPWEDVVGFEPFNSTLHYGPIPYRREQLIHIHVKPTSRHFRNGKHEKPLALDFMGIRESRGDVLAQMTEFHERKNQQTEREGVPASP